MRFHRGILVVGAMVGGLLIGGCDATVDSGELEDQLSDQLEADVGERPANVDCPDGVDAEAGETTRCTITAGDGTEIGVTITVTEVDGSDVQFSYKVDDEPLS